MDTDEEARIEAVLARARRWEAIGDGIEARRKADEEGDESWVETWERAAVRETIKWAEGVIAQADRLETSKPPEYDIDLFVVVLNLLRNAVLHYIKLVGRPAADRLLPLAERLDVIAPHLAQARHAIEHADEWNIGIGRTQPHSPLVSRRGAFRHLRNGIIEAPFVAEGTTRGGTVDDDMAWLFPETASIPVVPVQQLAQKMQAEAIIASQRFTARLHAERAGDDPDEEDPYSDINIE